MPRATIATPSRASPSSTGMSGWPSTSAISSSPPRRFIINFGSISWMTASGGMPAYTTSKAAVHGLTRGFARDLGPYNIRANTITPAWVMTERKLALWVTPESEVQMDQAQCLRGRLKPEDIANMVLFLASDDARMITSQNFVVDAGWS